MATGRKALVALLALVGLVIVAIGIVYLVVKVGSLPSFFPGHIAHARGHRWKRGYGAVVVGAALLVAAVVVAATGRRRHTGR